MAVAGGLSVVIRRVFTRGAHAKRLAPTAHCRAPRSERYVRRLAAEPETQFLITETLRPHIAKLLQLMPKALAVIEEASPPAF